MGGDSLWKHRVIPDEMPMVELWHESGYGHAVG